MIFQSFAATSRLLPELELLDELEQGRQLLLLYQLELVDEEDEVLEAGVEVVLQAQPQDDLEVGVVDVSVHSEQSLEDGLDGGLEHLREGDADLAGEDGLVVELVLHPGHQQLDVLGRWHLQRRLHIVPICPQVLEFLPRAHHRARILGAVLGQGPIQDRDLVIELDRINCQPLVKVLARRQLHRKGHVPAAQSHLRDVLQVHVFAVLLHWLHALHRLHLEQVQKLQYFERNRSSSVKITKLIRSLGAEACQNSLKLGGNFIVF